MNRHSHANFAEQYLQLYLLSKSKFIPIKEEFDEQCLQLNLLTIIVTYIFKSEFIKPKTGISLFSDKKFFLYQFIINVFDRSTCSKRSKE